MQMEMEKPQNESSKTPESWILIDNLTLMFVSRWKKLLVGLRLHLRNMKQNE